MALPAAGQGASMGAPNASDFLDLYRHERPEPARPLDEFLAELRELIRAHPIDGGLADSSHLVTVSSYAEELGGTYVYDLTTDRFLRLSDATSKFAVGGSAPDGQLIWDTPVNKRHGAKLWLGEFLS